jgi:hypothetical protein
MTTLKRWCPTSAMNDPCGRGAQQPASRDAFDWCLEAFFLRHLATATSLPLLCSGTFPFFGEGRGEGSSSEEDEEALKLSHYGSSIGCLEKLADAEQNGATKGLRVDAGGKDGGGGGGGRGGGGGEHMQTI